MGLNVLLFVVFILLIIVIVLLTFIFSDDEEVPHFEEAVRLEDDEDEDIFASFL